MKITDLSRMEAKARKQNIPLNAHIDLTYRCNFICEHCILPTQFGGTELSTAEVTRVLEEIADLGALILTLSGGEVFLRKDLDEILGAADRLRFRTHLYTHGNFIDSSRVDMLIRRHVSEVQISFYSVDPCVHEAVTRVPGSHAKSLAAIELLQAAGVHVIIACPIMRVNFGTMPETIAFARARGIPLRATPEIQPTYAGELHTLGTRISSCDLPNVYLSAWSDDLLRDYAARVKKHRFDEETLCGAARTVIYVNPIGNVQGCTLMGGLSAGNVREARLADIWKNSEVLNRIRGIHEEDRDGCKRCMNADHCSFCMANSWNITKTLLTPVSVTCDQSNAKRLAVEEYKRRLPVVAA